MSHKKHKQPPSEAQLAANRANALKSTGPKTPEGKARSSMNAWKHGLTARGAVLTHECEEDFEQLALAYRMRYLPADSFELHLLDQIILVHWHMDRLRYVQSFHIEQEIYNPDVANSYPDLDPEIDTHALPAIAYRTIAETSRVLDITNRELARLSREYARLNQVFLDIRHHIPPADPGLEPAQPEPAADQPVQNEAKLSPPDSTVGGGLARLLAPGPVNSRRLAGSIRFKAKEVPVDIRPPLIARAA